MIATGPAEQDLKVAATETGVRLENVRRQGLGTAFTLRPTSDHRRSVSRSFDYGTGTERRRKVNAVCWHGHYEFMARLFVKFPNMRLKSAVADYRGVGDFNMLARQTGERNVGSEAYPVGAEDQCRCYDWSVDPAIVDDSWDIPTPN